MSRITQAAIGLALSAIATAASATLVEFQAFENGVAITPVGASSGIAVLTGAAGSFIDLSILVKGEVVLTAAELFSQLSATATKATTLTVKFTQTGLTEPVTSLTSLFTGDALLSNGAYTSFSVGSWIDSTNTAFGTESLLAAVSFGSGGVGTYTSGPLAAPAAPGSLWSETTIYTFGFSGRGMLTASADVSVPAAPTTVPEPATLALAGMALLGAGVARRRR